MKTILPILILFFSTLCIGCSDNAVDGDPDPEENDDKTSTNYISEVYFLHGTAIDRDPDCFPCTVDFEYSYDTTKIATIVSVKYLEENADSVQFFGLDGANSSRKAAYPPDCTESEVLHEYCTYATYDNGMIDLDIFRGGYLYKGQGTLENDMMSVNGLFKYRGDSVGHNLSGQKIEGLGGLRKPEYSKTGLYFVGGEKITTTYSGWPIPEGEEPEIDTVRVEFSTHLKVQDDQETIRFAGLPGADAGEMENRVFPNCTQSENCIILGQSTGVETFDINIEHNGRTYQANGNARSSDFELTGQYQYQNTTINYSLEGRRYVGQ